MNILSKIRISSLADAIICMIVGLVLVIWPGATMDILCKALAVVLIVAGAVMVISFFTNRNGTFESTASFAIGIIILILGIWIFTKSAAFISLIPIIAGVIVAVGGMMNVAQSISLAGVSYGKWWVALLLAAITVILGVFLIFCPLTAVSVAVRIIGFIMIYNGISNIWVLSRVNKFVKDVKQDINAVDSKGHEV